MNFCKTESVAETNGGNDTGVSIHGHGDHSAEVFELKVTGESVIPTPIIKTEVIDFEKELNFVCDICGRECSSSISLQFHKKQVHDRVKLYTCHTCGRSFKNNGAFHRHKKSHLPFQEQTDESVKQCTCHTCGQSFKNNGAFHRHMKSHLRNMGIGELQNKIKSHAGSKSSVINKTDDQVEVENQRENVENNKMDKCESESSQFLHQDMDNGDDDRIVNSKEAFKTHMTNQSSHVESSEMHHECTTCFKTFINDESLQKHLVTHADEAQLQLNCKDNESNVKKKISKMCKICNKVLSRATDLTRHMKIHTRQKHKCNLCSKLFKRMDCLLHHKKLYHKESSLSEDKIIESYYECELCHQTFQLKTVFDKHIKDHLEKKVDTFVCKNCGKLFHEAATLCQHIMTSHSEDRPYKCNICGRTFEYSTSYSRHMLSHPGDIERPHVCGICQKSYAKVSTLNAHMKIHKKDKPFKCQSCNKAFYTRSCLHKHSKSHSEEKPFPCNGCGQRFRQERSAKRHMLMHSGECSHKCPVCDKTFEMNFQLSKHMNIHSKEGMSKKKSSVTMDRTRESRVKSSVTGDRTQKSRVKLNIHFKGKLHRKKLSRKREMGANSKVCKICNKVLANQKTLTCHMRTIHLGEKYKCDFCDRSFIRISVLKSHLRIIHKQVLVNHMKGLEGNIISVRHGDSKKILLKCPVCSLLFIHRSEVVTHIRIHTGQKPYECSFCGATFNGRDQLQEHMDGHPSYRVKEKVCSICGKQFVKTSDFKRHIRMHSGLKPFGCVQCGKAFARQDGMLAHVQKIH